MRVTRLLDEIVADGRGMATLLQLNSQEAKFFSRQHIEVLDESAV